MSWGYFQFGVASSCISVWPPETIPPAYNMTLALITSVQCRLPRFPHKQIHSCNKQCNRHHCCTSHTHIWWHSAPYSQKSQNEMNDLQSATFIRLPALLSVHTARTSTPSVLPQRCTTTWTKSLHCTQKSYLSSKTRPAGPAVSLKETDLPQASQPSRLCCEHVF